MTLRQSYLTRKVHTGEQGWFPALREIQLRIEDWFDTELQKIKYQSRVADIQESEKVRIFHHELHQKHIKRSSILKLETAGGTIEGHKACSEHLHEVIANLLENPAELDRAAQRILLQEVVEQFTSDDNKMLAAAPTKAEVKESIDTSNLLFQRLF